MATKGVVGALCQAVSVGTCVGILVFAACWALAWASVSASSPRSAAAIRAAYASRDLRPDAIPTSARISSTTAWCSVRRATSARRASGWR